MRRRGIIDKKTVLEHLKVGRDGASLLRMKAKINSDEYREASNVMKSIDALAELLTGDLEYFWLKTSPSPDIPPPYPYPQKLRGEN